MERQIKVDIGRTNVIQVGLGFDVSADTITSQIRAKVDPTSDLIATWVVSFVTDGTDGEIILTLDDTVTGAITARKGYMDLKRLTNTEPVSIFDEPLEVIFRQVVTA